MNIEKLSASQQKKSGIINIFLIISLACTGLFLVLLIATKGDAAQWLVMENNFDYTFTDHFRHIGFASDLKNFYFNTVEAPFPAFAYLLYYLLVKIDPPDIPWGVEDWEAVMAYRFNLLVYLAIVIVLVLIFKTLTDHILPECPQIKRTAIAAAVLLSAPFISGCIERGNISFLTAILMLAAVYLKDEDNKYAREAALILIAMAASLKIYPAFLGLIYIREKRWKEAVRLIIYGLLFFLVPFAFTGGAASFIRFCKVIFFFEGKTYRSWTNIRGVLLSISDLLGQYENSPNFVKYFKIAENVYLLGCIATLFKTKTPWKYVLYMTGIMSLYVSGSHRYVACYMMIPLMMYLRAAYTEDEATRPKLIYGVLFALTFTLPFYGYFTGWQADLFVFLPIYIIMGYSFIEDWRAK